MAIIQTVVCLLLEAYYIVLLGYIVFSFVPRPPDAIRPLVDGVNRLVDPVVAPIRRRLSPVAIGSIQLDLSLIVVFIGLAILRAIVC